MWQKGVGFRFFCFSPPLARVAHRVAPYSHAHDLVLLTAALAGPTHRSQVVRRCQGRRPSPAQVRTTAVMLLLIAEHWLLR